MTQISHLRFTLLDLVPAVVWGVGISWAGYVLGQGAEQLLGDLEDYRYWLAGAGVVLGLIVVGLYARYRMRNR